MANALNWFEIPVLDFERAKKFYEKILGQPMQTFEAMGMKSAFFPADLQSGHIGGCIIQGQGYEPSGKGSLIFLNGGTDLSSQLDRVEAAGGAVVLPKTSMGMNGFSARFTDTEGNLVGLHSMA